MLPKKISWLILVSLFTFDAVLSYWAVAFRGAREADPLIKYWVEKYPLLYFLILPILTVMMFYVSKGLIWLVRKMFKKASGDLVERVVLTALVGYWILGNSSMNFLYLIGHKQPARVWYMTTSLMMIPAFVYVFWVLRKSGSGEDSVKWG